MLLSDLLERVSWAEFQMWLAFYEGEERKQAARAAGRGKGKKGAPVIPPTPPRTKAEWKARLQSLFPHGNQTANPP